MVYNAVAAAAVIVFAVALWVHGVWYRSHLSVSAPAPATVPAGEASQPVPIILPRSEISRLSPAPGNPSIGAIDAVTFHANLNDAPPENIVHSGSTLFVRGWVASSDKTAFRGIIIVVDHGINIDGSAQYGGKRPDVASAYNAANMTYTGFSGVAVPTKGLRIGRHSIQVGGLSADHRHYSLMPAAVNFILK
jgi:hypothetical protein